MSKSAVSYLVSRIRQISPMVDDDSVRITLETLAKVAREDIVHEGFFTIPNIAVLKVLEKSDKQRRYFDVASQSYKTDTGAGYLLRAYPSPVMKRIIKSVNDGKFYEEKAYDVYPDPKTNQIIAK